MMKLFLNRFRRDHGAIVGRLSQEVVNRQGIVVGHQYICDTMEREGGCLEPGEYHIMVAKCKCFARQMLFLEPIRDDSSSSSSLPLPETCKLCRMERKSHEFGCLEELYALPCPMMQPGNGPFRLRQGGILNRRGSCSRVRTQESGTLPPALRPREEGDGQGQRGSGGSGGGNGVRDTLARKTAFSRLPRSFIA